MEWRITPGLTSYEDALAVMEERVEAIAKGEAAYPPGTYDDFDAWNTRFVERKAGVKPIIGMEAYVAPGDRRTKSGVPGETQNHLVLLAETLEGYHNLIKLVSSGYTEGFYYKPRIDKDLLAQHAEGLIGLSSCLKGEVASEIRGEQMKKAAAAAARYRDILGKGNFFLEMQYQGIDEQRIVNTGLLPIARDLDMPLVCTNDVHYLRHGDHKPHDILLCIGTGKSVKQAAERAYNVVKELHVPDLMWRDDIGEKLKKEIPELQKHGYADEFEYGEA